MQAALAALFEGVGNTQVVGTASSKMDATEWLQKNREAWDVVTLDLLLQEDSGYNLIARFKQQNARGHVVVLSDFATHAVEPPRVPWRLLGLSQTSTEVA